MQHGENLQALHKNLEFIRFVSILLLLIHYYCVCYPALEEWGFTVGFVTRLLFGLSHGLFFLSGVELPKLIIAGLLGISLFGETGKKDNKLTPQPVLLTLGSGLLLYFLSSLVLRSSSAENVK